MTVSFQLIQNEGPHQSSAAVMDVTKEDAPQISPTAPSRYSNSLPWRHRKIRLIAELYWIQLRNDRFQLLRQSGLNKLNNGFWFLFIRILRHV